MAKIYNFTGTPSETGIVHLTNQQRSIDQYIELVTEARVITGELPGSNTKLTHVRRSMYKTGELTSDDRRLLILKIQHANSVWRLNPAIQQLASIDEQREMLSQMTDRYGLFKATGRTEKPPAGPESPTNTFVQLKAAGERLYLYK
ncbi:MAG TPA: hypothetical protein VHP58_04250 [Alphaproteobacteria bacterium]|nr:hypothetical protein [Alphaproteobacteria bacterium]